MLHKTGCRVEIWGMVLWSEIALKPPPLIVIDEEARVDLDEYAG